MTSPRARPQATASKAPGTSSRSQQHRGRQTAALKVARTSAGTVLASSRGLTLYYYTEDKPGSGKSVCTGSCASAWPPLAAPVRAPAGVRLPGPLGMITRPGGLKQVTINGYPDLHLRRGQGPGAGRRQRHRRRLARHQGLTRGVLGAQFGFQQVHGLEEGGLLAGGELVQDPGERAGRFRRAARLLSRGLSLDAPSASIYGSNIQIIWPE